MKYIMGTVQLGLDYGINNHSGKPDCNKALQILERAWDLGVRMLDTAAAYGDAEAVIGEFHKISGNAFEICTKLNPSVLDGAVPGGIQEKIEQEVLSVIKRLRVSSLSVYYLHRFEQCKSQAIIETLIRLKNEGYIKKLGVSIYNPEEFQYIAKQLGTSVDVIQLPFSILDCTRWLDKNLLEQARLHNITIFVRSIFLQGLIFMNPEEQKAAELGASEYLFRINMAAKEEHVSVSQLAIGFVKSQAAIDGMILGSETLEQLEDNFKNFSAAYDIGSECRLSMIENSKNIPGKIIDPRMWS